MKVERGAWRLGDLEITFEGKIKVLSDTIGKWGGAIYV